MKSKVPLKILKIDEDGYHLIISARINGKPSRLVVDTGASRTVFDKERIKRFLDKEEIRDIEKLSTGLGTNSMQSQVTNVAALRIGTIELVNYHSILLDLSHVNQSYESIGLKPVEGVIGSDILKRFKAIIDFHHKLLTLEIPTLKTKKKRSSKTIQKSRKGKK